MIFRVLTLFVFTLAQSQCKNILQFSPQLNEKTQIISFFSSAGDSFIRESVTSLVYYDGKIYLVSERKPLRGLLVHSPESDSVNPKVVSGVLNKVGEVCTQTPLRDLDQALTKLSEKRDELDRLTDRLLELTDTLKSDPKFNSLVVLMEFNRSVDLLINLLKEHRSNLMYQRKQLQEFIGTLDVNVPATRTNSRTYTWILLEHLRNLPSLDSIRDAVYSLAIN